MLGLALQTAIDFPDTCTSGLRVAQPESDGTAAQDGRFELYPNPADNLVSIEYVNPTASANGSRLRMTDVLGKTLEDRVLEGRKGMTTIDVSALPAGVYVVTWMDNTGDTYQRKLVVTHP